MKKKPTSPAPKHALQGVSWKLVIILALVQLIRPIMSTTGLFDDLKPQGPLIVTTTIVLIWIGTVVIGKVKEPIKTLALAGAVYAVFSILMAVFLQAFFDWSEEETVAIPLLLTAGLIGSVIYNVLVGGFLGLVAVGIRKALRK